MMTNTGGFQSNFPPNGANNNFQRSQTYTAPNPY